MFWIFKKNPQATLNSFSPTLPLLSHQPPHTSSLPPEVLTPNAASLHSFPPLPIPRNTPCHRFPAPPSLSQEPAFFLLSLTVPSPSQAFPSQVARPEPPCCLQARLPPDPSVFPCPGTPSHPPAGCLAANTRGSHERQSRSWSGILATKPFQLLREPYPLRQLWRTYGSGEARQDLARIFGGLTGGGFMWNC